MVIFFIRNSVDIDHVTPVIHKVASKNSNNLIVLCLNPRLNIYFDYRLRYLRENYNISIDYAYNILKRGFKDRFNQYIYCNRNNLQNNKGIYEPQKEYPFYLVQRGRCKDSSFGLFRTMDSGSKDRSYRNLHLNPNAHSQFKTGNQYTNH